MSTLQPNLNYKVKAIWKSASVWLTLVHTGSLQIPQPQELFKLSENEWKLGQDVFQEI